MTDQEIITILQGLPQLITKCTLNERVFDRIHGSWWEGDSCILEG